MIRFDRIKIQTRINYVKDFSADLFECNERSGKIMMAFFHSKKTSLPFDLEVKLDFCAEKLIIDLPSKILQQQYFEGINAQNIRMALTSLWKEFRIIELHSDDILRDANVLSVDVFRDLVGLNLEKSDIEFLATQTNCSKWMPEKYRHGINFQSRRKRRKISLSFYNKKQEILLAKNRLFLQEAQLHPHDMHEDSLRVELKLQSLMSLRKEFNTEDTSIQRILHAKAEPIRTVLCRIIDSDQKGRMDGSLKGIGDFKNYLFVKAAEFDIVKLQTLIKRFYKPTTNVRTVLQKYRPFLRLGRDVKDSCIDQILQKLDEEDVP